MKPHSAVAEYFKAETANTGYDCVDEILSKLGILSCVFFLQTLLLLRT